MGLSEDFWKLQLWESEHPNIREASPPNFPWNVINLIASTILVWCLHKCSQCLELGQLARLSAVGALCATPTLLHQGLAIV